VSNPLRRIWAEGRTAFGMWAMMPDSFGAELLAGSGADYVCVDQQHGLVDYEAMVPMLQGIHAGGAAPITRVPASDPYLIGKALDAGVLGVIVPMVNSPEEAARAVAACRYPPRGTRSYGPVRASAAIGSGDPEDLERGTLCFVMVETREGLDRVEEIAATPGLDGIYVGPADLALSLGLRPTFDLEDPRHVEAVRKIRETCERHGIVAGVHSGSGEWARRHAEAGFGMVTVAIDAVLLKAAALQEVAVARGGCVHTGPGREYS
jgi:4-hydroxy-2-oxoheptanedioate aldolase